MGLLHRKHLGENLRAKMLWSPLFLLILTVSSCNPRTTSAEKTIIPTLSETANTVPEETIASSSGAKPEATNAVTPKPILTPSTTPTDKPSQIGIKLAFSPEAENHLKEDRSVPSDIKEQIYFLGGPGGASSCEIPDDISQPGFSWLGIIARDHTQICFWGLPSDDEIKIDFYNPDDQHAFSKKIAVSEVVGGANYIEEKDNTLIGRFFIWLPTGTPIGDWKIVVSSGNVSAQGVFVVPPPDRPVIITLPDLYIDPFDDRSCDTYSVGDQVIVAGSGFGPIDCRNLL
jgi:hypothetical protein